MRMIDADELRDEIDSHNFNDYDDYSIVMDAIDDAPTIGGDPDWL